MKIDVTACVKKYIEWLDGIPYKWRKLIAEAMCSSMAERVDVDCDQVRDCETVTSLSDFVVSGTTVCITYIDEKATEVERCFDFSEILNNSLDGVDPQCIATSEDWDSFSVVEKVQAIVDKVCTNCDSTTTTTTTP